MKDFYCFFFNGHTNEKYESTSELHANFESYFVSFGDGSRLELMHMPTIASGMNAYGHEAIGLIHIAFSMETKDEVDTMTKKAHDLGLPVILEPHRTGDGYYEACILDPDGNRVEITILP